MYKYSISLDERVSPITNIRYQLPIFDLRLPKKPIICLILRQVIEKLILNEDLFVHENQRHNEHLICNNHDSPRKEYIYKVEHTPNP